MQEKGFRVIDIDFEYIPAEDRYRFAAFVELVSRVFGAFGYQVSVALAPKTSADQPGLLYELSLIHICVCLYASGNIHEAPAANFIQQPGLFTKSLEYSVILQIQVHVHRVGQVLYVLQLLHGDVACRGV